MPFDELVSIMRRLRSPEDGCPWDLKQTRETLKPYLVEETYEVLEAIDGKDPLEIREELGDLLFQIVFHARLGEERGQFDMEDIIVSIRDKMIRRHPHIFGDVTVSGADEVSENWDALKKKEGKQRESLLDGVPASLPALLRAYRLQQRAARVGFDWKRIEDALEKFDDEYGEFRAAVESGDPDAVLDELGDVLFMLVNLSRTVRTNPEEALRGGIEKFSRRFRFIEQAAAEAGRTLDEMTLKEMDALWEEAKKGGKQVRGQE